MPTYDYECDACGHAFELFHSIKDPARKKCPCCGRNKLRRLIGSGGAILFKGSGFYTTDYRSHDYKKEAKAESSTDTGSDSGSKSEGKSGSSGSSDSSDKSES